MKQLELNPKPEILNCCPWARPHRHGLSCGVVLAIPAPLPLGFAPWLRAQGWKCRDITHDRGQYAAWLVGGNDTELLGWLPRPAGHGSYTAGNYLPW